MKLSDVEAFKLKFARKNKKFVPICEKMVLSSFSTDKPADISDVNYPYFNCTNNQLVAYTVQMFMETKPKHVSEQTIKDISYTIAINYNIVPYHNFTHGFSVAQFFYYMWKTSESLKKWVSDEDMFIITMACIGHDLRHPGKNNGYQTARRNDCALVSFDNSVLESMHAATL